MSCRKHEYPITWRQREATILERGKGDENNKFYRSICVYNYIYWYMYSDFLLRKIHGVFLPNKRYFCQVIDRKKCKQQYLTKRSVTCKQAAVSNLKKCNM